MPMLLHDYPMPRSIGVRARPFDSFWAGSRFRDAVAGIDLRGHVKQALDDMEAGGGFYTALECESGGRPAGSLVVFRDPWYRSRRRADVACFGLVTAGSASALEARLVARRHGCAALRGPVNPPRSLLGYGVLVDGYDKPPVAGTSVNTGDDAAPFMELDAEGCFDGCDRYYNLSQDCERTRAYISTIELDRSFRVVNPDLSALGDLPGKVAALMNDTLGYRADYQWTSAERLAEQAQAYRAVPGGEQLMAFFFDGDVLAGGVIMQPDWFQVLRGEPATTVVGDIYMLAPAYQGRRLFMNCSEYSMKALRARDAGYYEHASVHEGTAAVLSSVRNGYAAIVREARVYEVRT